MLREYCRVDSLCSCCCFKEQHDLFYTTDETKDESGNELLEEGRWKGEEEYGAKAKGREDGNQMSALPYPPAQLCTHTRSWVVVMEHMAQHLCPFLHLFPLSHIYLLLLSMFLSISPPYV